MTRMLEVAFTGANRLPSTECPGADHLRAEAGDQLQHEQLGADADRIDQVLTAKSLVQREPPKPISSTPPESTI